MPLRKFRVLLAIVMWPVLLLAALGSADDPYVDPNPKPRSSGPAAGYGMLPPQGQSTTTPVLSPGQLGVQIANLSEPDKLFYRRETGAVIESVLPGSPAQRAGLLRNDVILAVDKSPAEAAADVIRLLQGTTAGQSRVLRILRNQVEQDIKVSF